MFGVQTEFNRGALLRKNGGGLIRSAVGAKEIEKGKKQRQNPCHSHTLTAAAVFRVHREDSCNNQPFFRITETVLRYFL